MDSNTGQRTKTGHGVSALSRWPTGVSHSCRLVIAVLVRWWGTVVATFVGWSAFATAWRAAARATESTWTARTTWASGPTVPHAFELLALLIGQELVEFLLHFFFQGSKLLFLFFVELQLLFHGWRNEGAQLEPHTASHATTTRTAWPTTGRSPFFVVVTTAATFTLFCATLSTFFRWLCGDSHGAVSQHTQGQQAQ